MIGLKLRDYCLTEQIYDGSHTEVYRATHHGTNRQVAVKILKRSTAASSEFLLEHFYREAKIMVSLDHPNILGALEFGCLHDLFYLTMPFIEGRTLAERTITSSESQCTHWANCLWSGPYSSEGGCPPCRRTH